MSIEKRGDKYRVSIRLPRDADGRYPRIVRQVDTYRQAQRLQGDMLKERDRSLHAKAGKMTVPAWLEYWLDNVAAHKLAPSTLARYRQIVDLHLSPAFAKLPLSKLTALHIERYQNRALKEPRPKKGKPLSPATVRQHLAVLHKALQDAVKRRVITDNPADGIDMPQPPRFKPQTVSPERIGELIEATRGTRLFIPALLAIGCGMRLGEIVALTWADVDSDGATVCIVDPKTASGRRLLPLPQALTVALKAERKRQKEAKLALGSRWKDSGRVCVRQDGGPATTDSLSPAWGRFRGLHGFGGVRFHDLRHSYGTIQMAAGASPKAVAEALGHSDAGFTLRTYVHSGMDKKARMAERMDGLMRLSPDVTPEAAGEQKP
jgi:integrase